MDRVKKYAFLVCQHYWPEAKALFETSNNIDLFSYQAGCVVPSDAFKVQQPFSAENYHQCILLGGCSVKDEALIEDITCIKKNICFELFAPSELIKHYIKRRYYLITAGWLNRWEEIVCNRWKFDEKGAKEFFSEISIKLLYLDTDVLEGFERKLKRFSKFVGLEYEVLPVGLEHFSLIVDQAVGKIELKQVQEEAETNVQSAQQRSADYSMAFDLLSMLNQVLDENEVVQRIIEIFTMLYAPQQCSLVTYENSQQFEIHGYDVKPEILQVYMTMHERYRMLRSGFALKLMYDEKILAILIVDNIMFPEYKEYYLNLAINISDVCSLAIANARSYRQNREGEAYLMQQSKLAAMGEMLGAIAHQWRQPLNTLSIAIALLEEQYENGLLSEEVMDSFVENQTAIIQKLSKSITDFKSFYSLKGEKKRFDLAESLMQMIALKQHDLDKEMIEVNIIGESCSVYGVCSEFQQVFLNLLNNAVDALSEGKVKNKEVKVLLECQKQCTKVSVVDNGGGIPDTIVDRVFEPYFSTKEEGKGIGMGLYISKMVVEKKMGGVLSVKNIKEGAAFTITLGCSDE